MVFESKRQFCFIECFLFLICFLTFVLEIPIGREDYMAQNGHYSLTEALACVSERKQRGDCGLQERAGLGPGWGRRGLRLLASCLASSPCAPRQVPGPLGVSMQNHALKGAFQLLSVGLFLTKITLTPTL